MTSRIRCNLFSKAWRNDPATSRLPVQGWRSRHGGGRVHDRGVFALGGEIDNGAGQLEHLHRVVTGDVTHPPRRVQGWCGLVQAANRRSADTICGVTAPAPWPIPRTRSWPAIVVAAIAAVVAGRCADRGPDKRQARGYTGYDLGAYLHRCPDCRGSAAIVRHIQAGGPCCTS